MRGYHHHGRRSRFAFCTVCAVIALFASIRSDSRAGKHVNSPVEIKRYKLPPLSKGVTARDSSNMFPRKLSAWGLLRGGATMMRTPDLNAPSAADMLKDINRPQNNKDPEEINFDQAKTMLESQVNQQATQQIESCLGEFLLPDTDRVKAAEEFAKQAFRDVQSVPSLLYIMGASSRPEIRQLAAIFLRKLIIGHWDTIDTVSCPISPDMVKAMVIGLLAREPHTLTQRALAAAAATLNKRVHWKRKWIALEDFTFQGMASDRTNIREVSMLLLSFMSDEVALWLIDKETYGPKLLSVFQTGLKDADKRVSVMTLKAFASVASKLADNFEEMLQFESLVPLMLRALTIACGQGQDDIVVEVLEIVDELSRGKKSIVDNHVEEAINSLLAITNIEGVSDDIRDTAIGLLATLMQFKTDKVMASPRVQEVHHLAFRTIVAQVQSHPQEAEEKSGCDLLSTMAVHAPSSFQQSARITVEMMASPEPHMRAAGVLALGVIAEGCADEMRLLVEPMLQHVRKVLADQSQLVKRYALVALSHFSDDLGDGFLAKHMGSIVSELLPILKGDESNEVLVSSAATVLERMASNAEKEVLQPLIKPVLIEIVQAIRLHTSQNHPKAAADLIASVGALAEGAEEDFRPFASETIELLRQLWAPANPISVRGRAMEAVGMIAKAIGKESFLPYVDQAISTGVSALNPNDNDCETQMYGLYLLQGVTDALEVDIGPHIDTFAGTLVVMLKETKSVETKKKRDSILPTGPDFEINIPRAQDDSDEDSDDKRDDEDDEDELIESDDTEDDIGVRHVTDVRTGECEKLTAAIELLKQMCKYSPLGMKSFLKDIYKVTGEELVDNQDYTVRAASYSLLADLIKAGHKLAEFFKEMKDRSSQRWVNWVSECVDELSQELLWTGTHQFDVPTSESAVLAYAKIMGIPSKFSSSVVDDAQKLIKRILKGRTACQGYMSADSQLSAYGLGRELIEENKEAEKIANAKGEQEEIPILEAATSLMVSLARRKGVNFEKKFKRIAPLLQHLVAKGQDMEARALGARGFAEASLNLGAAAQPYVADLRPVLFQLIQEIEDKQKANAQGRDLAPLTKPIYTAYWSSIWCLGILCTVSSVEMKTSYPQMSSLFLRLLDAPILLEMPDHRFRMMVKDNVAFATARMMRADSDSVPMQSLLPKVLDALPMRGDTTELEVVTNAVVALWKKREKTLLSMLPKVLGAAARTLAVAATVASDGKPPAESKGLREEGRVEIDNEGREALVQMCSEIIGEARTSGQLPTLLSGLQDGERKALEQILSSRQS